MNILFQQITSLEEVDLQGLFNDSFPDIDINFFNHTEVSTIEEKSAFYFNQLLDAMNGQSYLQNPGDRFIMFKGSYEGIDCVFNAGFIDLDVNFNYSYRGHWYLSRPINGSRSWIRDTDTTELRNQFFSSIGVSSYKARGKSDSLMLSSIRRNPNVTVINEATINNGQDTELTISVL